MTQDTPEALPGCLFVAICAYCKRIASIACKYVVKYVFCGCILDIKIVSLLPNSAVLAGGSDIGKINYIYSIIYESQIMLCNGFGTCPVLELLR